VGTYYEIEVYQLMHGKLKGMYMQGNRVGHRRRRSKAGGNALSRESNLIRLCADNQSNNMSTPHTQPLSSFFTFMSSPLRPESVQSQSRIPRLNIPTQDLPHADEQIAPKHDPFQWATPPQNESPLRRAGCVVSVRFNSP
jgi:hypothetical protein